jgi:hypothetical protein
VGGEDARVPFYRVRGVAGRLGVGEERAPAVVRHNGIEGGCFRSGIGRGVMGGGGENVLRPLRKRKGEGHREAAAHARAGGGTVPEWLEEEDERGARVSDGEWRIGPSRPGIQGPRGVGEGWPAGPVEGEGRPAGLAGPKAKWTDKASQAESEK